jgi:hypothetical protein
MSSENTCDKIPCLTIGLDEHTCQVLWESGYQVVGFRGDYQETMNLVDCGKHVENIVTGTRIEKNVVLSEFQLLPTYRAYSTSEYALGDVNNVFWGSAIVHPTAWVSSGAFLEQAVIVGPQCFVPDGCTLMHGSFLFGGSRLRVKLVVREFQNIPLYMMGS